LPLPVPSFRLARAVLLAAFVFLGSVPLATAQEDVASQSELITPDQPALDQPAAEPVLAPGTPLRLVQPRLGIDARIVPVGTDENGAMAAPSDPATVAWWSLGFDAAAEGNVVLAGHVNWGGLTRVFAKLSEAQLDDVFYLTDATGTEHGYLVTWVRSYEAASAPLEEIFLPDAPGHQLTLITCGGRFDTAQRLYLDRWVVRAQRIEHSPVEEPAPESTAAPAEPVAATGA
jgi:hypothetical protein